MIRLILLLLLFFSILSICNLTAEDGITWNGDTIEVDLAFIAKVNPNKPLHCKNSDTFVHWIQVDEDNVGTHVVGGITIRLEHKTRDSYPLIKCWGLHENEDFIIWDGNAFRYELRPEITQNSYKTVQKLVGPQKQMKYTTKEGLVFTISVIRRHKFKVTVTGSMKKPESWDE